MKDKTDVIAIKLIHMMFRKGLIDATIYRQILTRYAN